MNKEVVDFVNNNKLYYVENKGDVKKYVRKFDVLKYLEGYFNENSFSSEKYITGCFSEKKRDKFSKRIKEATEMYDIELYNRTFFRLRPEVIETEEAGVFRVKEKLVIFYLEPEKITSLEKFVLYEGFFNKHFKKEGELSIIKTYHNPKVVYEIKESEYISTKIEFEDLPLVNHTIISG